MAHSATATAQPCSCRRHFPAPDGCRWRVRQGKGFSSRAITTRSRSGAWRARRSAKPLRSTSGAALPADDFAEVMFAGVMEDRSSDGSERVAVSAPAPGPTQRGESPPPGFRQPVQEGSRHTPHARRCMPSRAAARTSFRCRCCARYRAGSHRGCARLSRPWRSRQRASAHRRGRRCGAGPARAAHQIALAEKFSIARSAGRRCDFALIEPLAQIVRGGPPAPRRPRRQRRIGNRLPHLHAGDPLTTSFRLSRCWTLTVVKTSIPASSSSSTSCQRFGWREHCCAPAHPPESAPDGGEGGVEIELIDVPPAMGKPPRRQSAQALQHRGGLYGRGSPPRQSEYPALGAQPLRFRQHRPCFPHPAQAPKNTFSLPRCGAAVCCSRRSGSGRSGSSLIYLSFRASSAILSCSILTTGWPRKLSSGVCGLIHQLGYLLNAQLARLSHPGHLPQRGGRSQVVIETARRGGDQFDRHPRVGVLARRACTRSLTALSSAGLLAARLLPPEAMGLSVVSAVADGRPEIACGGEVLANQRRAAHFTVQADQRAVGLS